MLKFYLLDQQIRCFIGFHKPCIGLKIFFFLYQFMNFHFIYEYIKDYIYTEVKLFLFKYLNLIHLRTLFKMIGNNCYQPLPILDITQKQIKHFNYYMYINSMHLYHWAFIKILLPSNSSSRGQIN